MVEAVRDMWRADFGQWIEDGAVAYFATQFPENSVSNEDVAWTFRACSVFPSVLPLTWIARKWKPTGGKNAVHGGPNTPHPRRYRRVNSDRSHRGGLSSSFREAD